MEPIAETIWDKQLTDPSLGRKGKPRQSGLTMIIDKGLGWTQFKDLLELASDYIDFIKLGFGTAVLTPLPVLQKKLETAHQYDVHLYPGGTFFEAAYHQKAIHHYLRTLSEIGFDWVEISDGTITLNERERRDAIAQARTHSFRVITEIGKKEKGSVTPSSQIVEIFHQDREQGAEYIILEGRESGENVGIFNSKGDVDTRYVQEVHRQVDPSRIWWECPQSAQQITILKLLGADTNLGNIPAQEVLSVESLRRGLRSDTFFTFGNGIREGSLL
ncbi:MAG: phosphosulfolactate synthase [Firmicutes bacterium]|nr:phosphosulfolactate synthase [Bacillota bacterium]